VGVIVKNPTVTVRVAAVFEDDWSLADQTRQDVKDANMDEKAEAKVEAEENAAAKAEAKAGAAARV
jgi:hypothetical protein